ncbi:MAG: glutathione synthase [Burkholderiaceae bacterium]
MSAKLLFILDPLDEVKTYKDSTYAMMLEASQRGHQVFACEQHELSFEGGQALAVARELAIEDGADPWYRAGDAAQGPLTRFDAVLMRKDPPFDMEYVYSTYLLERAVAAGARVFNDPRAIRDHNEKMAICEFPQYTAPTLVTRSAAALRRFVDEHGDAVFKLLDGMGGASIFRATKGDPNLSVIIETMNLFGARSVMAQKFLPEIKDGDKRVLLIGGKVVPYCLARVPLAGESRGNLAAGGRGVARPLDERDRQIAEGLAPIVWSRGLLLVGLDIIGPSMTELNVTSPTCFQEIRQQTGCNVAGLFVDAVEGAIGGGVSTRA